MKFQWIMALVSLMGLNLYGNQTQITSGQTNNNKSLVKPAATITGVATIAGISINTLKNNNKEEINTELKPLKDFFQNVSDTTTQNIKIYYDEKDGKKLFDTTMYTFLKKEFNNDEAIYDSVLKQKREKNGKFLQIKAALENHTKQINEINRLLTELINGVDINIIMGTITDSLTQQSEYLNKFFKSSEDNAIIQSLLTHENQSLDIIKNQSDQDSIKKIRLLIVKTIIDKIVDTGKNNLFIKKTFNGLMGQNTTHENPLMRDGNALTIKFNYDFFKNTYLNLSSKSISGTNILNKLIKSDKSTNILDKFTKFNRFYDTIIKFLKTTKENYPSETIFLKEIFPPISDKKKS